MLADATGARRGRRTGPIAVLLALVAFAAFNANGREIPSYDSQPTKFLALEIAKRHTLSLGHVVGRVPALATRSAFAQDLQGNYRSAYPLPSAFAAGAAAWLLSAVHLVDLDAPLAANFIAKITASLLTALTVACAFLAAARRLSNRQAAVLALGLGLGTNLWAGVSQTLWQQETALLCLMAAILLLETAAPSLLRALAVGALIGFAGWARPQLAPTVAVLMISLLVRWQPRAAVAAIPVVAMACVAIAINLAWFGHPLGAVPALEALHLTVHGVSGSLETRPWLSAAGLLVSPSRGLLVFSPIVAIAAAGLGAAIRARWDSPLRWYLVAAVSQFVFYSLYKVWWAGHTYGPRYALDLLPLLVPLAIAGFPIVTRSRVLTGIAILALAWSVTVSAAGAFIYPAEQWNTDPTEVDHYHERLWEWRDSQIPRAFQQPSQFAELRLVHGGRSPPAPIRRHLMNSLSQSRERECKGVRGTKSPG